MIDEIQKNLEFVYGKNTAVLAAKRIRRKIAESDNRSVNGETFFSEKSLFLITYADLLRKEGQSPLGTLSSFLTEYLTEAFSTVHILPFFPYSSDDGFAVMDYSKVLSDYGSWEDIRTLAKRFSLMFDLVLNHISAQSQWFQQYLRGEEGFSLLAIEVDPSTDLSDVFRPRSTSLLTEFTKRNGEPVSLWTTFGADQVDFNFADIEILLLLVDVLLFFLRQGASVIRLDAIAYLWKEIGTSCIHLPQTHAIVRLFRSILQAVNDHALLLTETNVPHEENIQYFGNGYDEAHMVYNFSLPPLILYTFIEEDTTQLKDWLAGLDTPSEQTTYLNFTASHDGIGVLPLVDRVGKTGIDKVIERVVENGGSVSYKTNADGTRSPYEINITYVDALKKQEGPTPDNQLAERFLATQ